MVLPRLSIFARRFTTSSIRRSDHGYGGSPGENLPFDITSVPKFTIIFGLFSASAIALPFLIIRHQLLKQ